MWYGSTVVNSNFRGVFSQSITCTNMVQRLNNIVRKLARDKCIFSLFFNAFTPTLLTILLEIKNQLKVILCASEHICPIVRDCFRSFKQL